MGLPRVLILEAARCEHSLLRIVECNGKEVIPIIDDVPLRHNLVKCKVTLFSISQH